MSYEAVMQEIRDGALMTIDGATGTELQRRGAPMHKGAWCALATASHPDLLHAIHADYIRAGARVVTANTFATTREILEPLGFGDRFEALNRQAVEIALAARDSTPGDYGPVLVAGSISHTRPTRRGAWSPEASDVAKFEADCTEMAALFREFGCDLIMAEMMGCPTFTPCVMRAAKASGLPFWLGISTIRLDDDVLRTYTDEAMPLADVFRPILAEGGADVVGIMHSRPEVTLEALEMLDTHWPGPMMAYPDSLNDSATATSNPLEPDPAIDEACIVAHCDEWLDAGVQILGGCCGLSVSHVAAIRGLLDVRALPA